MGIRKTLKTLDAVIDDLTSLHVQTYTGTINWKDFWSKVGDVQDESKTSRSLRAFEGFSEQLPTDGSVSLVADTLMKFDGDSYNFIASDAASTQSALQSHKDAVASGINARLGLMELVRDLFNV